ncbi:hypothetical protein [Corallococcus carmarthensis]|uniref:Uncharacterized protein n=1 Tax=Corallococcus carmarthensis TaxID=2316728 RepID=A0A3A8K2G0_9BACT|nr:hypothetical protein [Corallococcus carmarthensis]RKG98654.1 hypothetical protein D7X32_28980 [Corallococcus carmarthensis]
MSSPPPYAIVVLSAYDPAVRDGAARVAQKLFKRNQVTVHPIPLESPGLHQTLSRLAGGTLYLVGHGDDFQIGDQQPPNLALKLEEEGLPETVARIHVLTCMSGVTPPQLQEAPALRLRLDLVALYQKDTGIRVTGLTGKSVDFGGSFRAIPNHPVVAWLDRVRDTDGDLEKLGELLDEGNELDANNAGSDAFQRLVEGNHALQQQDEEEQQIYSAIQMFVPHLLDKNARPDFWMMLYMLVQQMGDAMEDEELLDGEKWDSILSSLDTLEPLILQGLALSRQASKVHFS